MQFENIPLFKYRIRYAYIRHYTYYIIFIVLLFATKSMTYYEGKSKIRKALFKHIFKSATS